MNLRDFARKHVAFDGKVTFWMLEFHNHSSTIVYEELKRIDPENRWVHKESGEERFDDPHDNPTNDPIIEAQRKESPWTIEYLWTNAHNYFVTCEPITIDIEFKGTKLPAEVRALQAYWENRNGNIGHNFELFSQIVSLSASAAWLEAYTTTRDDSFNGPEELQDEPGPDADPNE